MEEERASETSVYFNETARHYIPEFYQLCKPFFGPRSIVFNKGIRHFNVGLELIQ
jgi:hypothetical protein